MCYGIPCHHWNGWVETCTKSRWDPCPAEMDEEEFEKYEDDMEADEDAAWKASAGSARSWLIGGPMSAITFFQRGFAIRCRARDLPSLLARLRAQYGDDVIYWGRDTIRH